MSEAQRTPRRVRLQRYVWEQVGRIPRPEQIALIEYPRVQSTCAGRPPVWEWRLQRAVMVRRR